MQVVFEPRRLGKNYSMLWLVSAETKNGARHESFVRL
jgi:hypothetical protein